MLTWALWRQVVWPVPPVLGGSHGATRRFAVWTPSSFGNQRILCSQRGSLRSGTQSVKVGTESGSAPAGTRGYGGHQGDMMGRQAGSPRHGSLSAGATGGQRAAAAQACGLCPRTPPHRQSQDTGPGRKEKATHCAGPLGTQGAEWEAGLQLSLLLLLFNVVKRTVLTIF